MVLHRRGGSLWSDHNDPRRTTRRLNIAKDQHTTGLGQAGFSTRSRVLERPEPSSVRPRSRVLVRPEPSSVRPRSRILVRPRSRVSPSKIRKKCGAPRLHTKWTHRSAYSTTIQLQPDATPTETDDCICQLVKTKSTSLLHDSPVSNMISRSTGNHVGHGGVV